jgi:hypothetical protein
MWLFTGPRGGEWVSRAIVFAVLYCAGICRHCVLMAAKYFVDWLNP